MACVFEATSSAANPEHQRVAIKILTPELARDPGIVARFQREARAVSLLKTRHVAHVLDVDVTNDGIPFIVMEFLEGRDLEAELEARGALPLGEVVDYVLQACAAMIEAHASGIIHRDLKPANLFVTNGTERLVKVLDFGISKMIGEATRLTGAGAVMGTVLYMPPEQIRATTDVDHRADIWAIGVILFELLAGRAPWEGAAHKVAAEIVSSDAPDVRKFAPVTEGVANVIRKMLQRNPDARYGSILEVVDALAPFAAQNTIGASIANDVAVASARARAAQPALGPRQARTMPLAAVPAAMTLPMAPPPSARTAPISSRAPSPSPSPAQETPRSQHVAFFAGFLVMLLVAGGVVLIVFSLRSKTAQPVVAPASASIASTASVLASIAPRIASAPLPAASLSVAETASATPAPPPTGTVARPGTAAASAARSAPRPQPTPLPANPTHL